MAADSWAVGGYEWGNGHRCGILVPAIPVECYREGWMDMPQGNWQVVRLKPGPSSKAFPDPRTLTTAQPDPVKGSGGPSGFVHNPSQDLVHWSLSGVGWEMEAWRDALEGMPLAMNYGNAPEQLAVER